MTNGMRRKGNVFDERMERKDVCWRQGLVLGEKVMACSDADTEFEANGTEGRKRTEKLGNGSFWVFWFWEREALVGLFVELFVELRRVRRKMADTS